MAMTGLYIGLTGIQQNSNALNTTANNIANVNTKGYVRQQVVFQDIGYNKVAEFATNSLQKGRGVSIQEVSHIRDILLDKAYRKENGREGFYEKLTDAAYEIQTQMGELYDVSFHDTITELIEAVNEVAKKPDDSVSRSALVQSAVSFVDRAKLIYDGLTSYQQNLNVEIANIVGRINEIGHQIRYYNQHISSIECGPETASTMRDERDLLIDELSTYVKIDAKEDDRGVVNVNIEGVAFCTNSMVCELGLEFVEGSDFYVPVWPDMENLPLYNMKATMSTAKNTDIGSLKGLLAARGSVTPQYTYENEVPEAECPNMEDYDLTTEEGKAAYDLAMDAYEEYRAYINYQESKDYSIIVNTMANFDKLVNGIVEAVNQVLSPTKEATVTYIDENGNEATYTGRILNMEKTGYGMDDEKTPGTELFSRTYCDRYKKVTGTDGETYYLYNDYNTFGKKTAYSIAELEVNEEVLYNTALLPLHSADGKVDYGRIEEIVKEFSKKNLNYNGGLEPLTFERFYETIIGDVGNTGMIYESMLENEGELTAGLDDARQQVMGVSSDEELTHLIRYQQAYGACSRFINVVASMMDTLANLVH